jgi:hypothetical protein
VKWLRDIPDAVWIAALLLDGAAAVYVGHALMVVSGH